MDIIIFSNKTTINRLVHLSLQSTFECTSIKLLKVKFQSAANCLKQKWLFIDVGHFSLEVNGHILHVHSGHLSKLALY